MTRTTSLADLDVIVDLLRTRACRLSPFRIQYHRSGGAYNAGTFPTPKGGVSADHGADTRQARDE
jgi:hypothetical protein